MRGVGIAVAVAVALAASGCSDDGDAAVPEDWVWFEGDGYAVAHPPEWQEAPEAFGEFTEMAVEGEPLSDTVPPVLTVDVERGPSAVATTAEQSAEAHLGVMSISVRDHDIIDRGDLDVPGAASAHRVSQRYTSTREAYEGDRLREDSVTAVGEEQVKVLLRVGVGEDDWEEFADTAEAIIASLALDP